MTAVLGLDLSLTSTGVAAVREGGAVAVARVRSKGAGGASVRERAARIRDIVDRIEFEAYRLSMGEEFALIVIEAPSYGSQGGLVHERGGLWWSVVSRVLGMAPAVATITPNGLKKYVTGSGAAQKDEVLAAMVRRFPELPLTNDTADALGLACMGVRRLDRNPIDGRLPEKNLSTLAAATWG